MVLLCNLSPRWAAKWRLPRSAGLKRGTQSAGMRRCVLTLSLFHYCNARENRFSHQESSRTFAGYVVLCATCGAKLAAELSVTRRAPRAPPESGCACSGTAAKPGRQGLSTHTVLNGQFYIITSDFARPPGNNTHLHTCTTPPLATGASPPRYQRRIKLFPRTPRRPARPEGVLTVWPANCSHSRWSRCRRPSPPPHNTTRCRSQSQSPTFRGFRQKLTPAIHAVRDDPLHNPRDTLTSHNHRTQSLDTTQHWDLEDRTSPATVCRVLIEPPGTLFD